MTLLAILSACGGSGSSGGATEIRFANVGNNGIFDPSITRDGTGKLWMSYSEVNFGTGTTAYWTVRTRIASSVNAGANWTDTGIVTDSMPVVGLSSPWEAWWQQETSRVAWDGADTDANRRLKILWHRYTYVHNTDTGAHGPAYDNGWIALKTAAAPGDLAAAPERKLFTGSFYNTANDAIDGPPEFPLAASYPGLADCAVFAEPGMLPVSDGVYVALRCATLPGSGKVGKLVLLKCTHTAAKAFAACSYPGDFLVDSEAAGYGAYNGFSAPDLVKVGAHTYLIVTPTNNDNYRGCLVFEVADVATAALVRDGGGKATVVKAVATASGADHVGACGYDAGAPKAGVVDSEYRAGSLPNFRVFASHIDL